MTTDPKDIEKFQRARLMRRGMVIGIAAAVLCQFLPAEYHELCRTVTSFCSGGLVP